MSYTEFKNRVMPNGVGKVIGDGQCVALVVNNSNAYIEYLFPGTNWTTIIPPVDGARQMGGKTNQYIKWVENDHNNPNQVPSQGDIMIFDATPKTGYTNPTVNPYGHTGICESANASGYTLLQQNSPAYGNPVNAKQFAWNFRPCLGWYVPQTTTVPAPTPQPTSTGHTLYLAPTNNDFHLYPEGGPYVYAAAKAIISPRTYGGLTYNILVDRGNGIYTVQTQMFGRGDLYTKGSDITIN